MKLFIMLLRVVFIWLSLGSILFAEHIENFEVNITLEPGGEFVVTESILYDFNGTHKHGIYREIPTQAYSMGNVNGVKWGVHFDIGLEAFEVQMDAEEVAWTKTFSKSSGKKVVTLKIGSKEKNVSGKKYYLIKYRCLNGIMPSSYQVAKDILHWNAVGDGWKVPILQTEVNLFLPPKLDRNNLVVVSPKKSEWIDDHHLYLKTDQKKTALKIVFPRGALLQDTELKIAQGRQNLKYIYEEKAQKKRTKEALINQIEQDTLLQKEHREIWGVWSWILFLILLSIVWFKRDALGLKVDTKSIVVRYEAPKDLSVLQAGLLFDKYLDNNDFYVAILELSYLGYLQIEEESKGVVLQRVGKPRGELSDDQWQLLEALFEGEDHFSSKEATPTQYAKLLKKVSGIYSDLYIWAKEQGYTVSNLSKIKGRYLNKILIILIPLFLFSLVLAMNGDYTGDEVSYILFCIFFALLPWFVVSYFNVSNRVKMSVLVLGVGLWFVLMEWKIFPRQRGMEAVDVMGSYITVITLLLVCAMVFVWKLGRYTQKGADVVRELKGLELFIRFVKEDEIRRRVEEEPDYMEKLFPYAVLFGQVKHWLEMYDILNIPLSKRKRDTLLKSLMRSDMLRSQTHNSGGESIVLSGSSSGSSGDSSSAGIGGGGSW